VILEVHLDDLVREAEHDRVARSHPLLHVNNVRDLTRARFRLFSRLFISLWLSRAFQVASKVLQQGYFLLQGRWVISDRVLFANVLTVSLPTLNVVKVVAIGV